MVTQEVCDLITMVQKCLLWGTQNDKYTNTIYLPLLVAHPYQVNTATYQNINFAVNGPTNCLDVLFNNDGTKMYVCSSLPSPSGYMNTILLHLLV